MRLDGQIAIITGAGRGIGRTIAQALARSGMSVAIVARTASELDETAALIVAAGGQALAFPLSVTDEDGVRQMVATVEQQWGAVDLLVNNAGWAGPLGPTWETTVPPDRAAEMVLTLASGQVDRLSGAFLASTDDLEMRL